MKPIKIKLFASLREYGPPESLLELPLGTTLAQLLKLYLIPEEGHYIIMVNGIPVWNRDYIIKETDEIALFPPIAGG